MLQVLTRILFIFCIILLIINVFAFVLFQTAEEPVTFTALLTKLEKAPTINLSLQDSVEIFNIQNDWGAFDFFRTIINALGAVIGLAVWISTLAINLVIFIGYALYLLGIQSFSAYV